jgi:hypothetical protein
MTSQPYPLNPGSTSPSRQRPLHPGSGHRLRQSYTKLIAASLIAAAIILAFTLFTAAASMGDAQATIPLVASVVVGICSACLIVALVRGRAAVHGDFVALPGIRRSGSLAKAGSLVGWLGAALVLVAGIGLHYQDVDNALLLGIVFGPACLIPAVCNDSARRIATRLVTS